MKVAIALTYATFLAVGAGWVLFQASTFLSELHEKLKATPNVIQILEDR